mmetsp:Transcript_21853/g.38999  ORF Transcript_21853/g.38999 Transcript_21853/m.38999 type:complete len:248 (+) Transcript_21853:76-819(+)
MQFVSFDETSKLFAVNEEAVKYLRSLDGPVCVVVACGRARQGKSFLLNQIQRKLQKNMSQEFVVASTHKPCTKGLWIWSHASPRLHTNGTSSHIVLIDCEGIDAFDQTMDYSTHIFSLGVLLASVLIYNQLGGIDEAAVNGLANVCNFASLIRDKAKEEGNSEGREGKGKGSIVRNGGKMEGVTMSDPAFIWLLRDFHLLLLEGNQKISATEYMEEALQVTSGAQAGVVQKNKVAVKEKGWGRGGEE